MAVQDSSVLERTEVERLVREVLRQKLRGQINPPPVRQQHALGRFPRRGAAASAGRQRSARHMHVSRSTGSSLRRRRQADQAERSLSARRVRLRATRHASSARGSGSFPTCASSVRCGITRRSNQLHRWHLPGHRSAAANQRQSRGHARRHDPRPQGRNHAQQGRHPRRAPRAHVHRRHGLLRRQRRR